MVHNTDCTQNDDFLWCNSINSYDRSNWILIHHFGGLCIMYFTLSFPLYIYIYIHIYMYVCMSVCLCLSMGNPYKKIHMPKCVGGITKWSKHAHAQSQFWEFETNYNFRLEFLILPSPGLHQAGRETVSGHWMKMSWREN